MRQHKGPMFVLLALIVLLPACAKTTVPAISPLDTPAATNAPPQRATDGLTLRRQTAFTDTSGTTYVVGEVHNGAQVSYREIQVSCDFYDSAGATLGSAAAPALIDILLPEESAFFKASLVAAPAGIASYSAVASGIETTDLPYTDLAFFRSQGFISEDDMTLLGEVLNAGQVAAYQVRIAAALLDGEGEILDVGWTAARRDLLFPSDVSPFTLFIGNVTGVPAQYELMAYGRQAPQDVVARQARLTVESDAVSRTRAGERSLVGEVRNSDDVNVASIKAVASLYDAQDSLVAVAWGYAWANLLAPDARSPFALNLNPSPAGIDHWNVWVEGQATDQPIAGDLQVESAGSVVDARSIATVSGIVRNVGDVSMRAIGVAVTVYDAQDRVLNVGWTELDESLAPNETAPFTIEVETSPEASRFALYVQGDAQDS
ncbi:MAG: FxLYD domain-containing protein [Anaerolineae bacterium]